MKRQTKSQVLAAQTADPADAARHFTAKAAFETDVADVAYDLREGITGFRLIDVRDARSYAEAHLPGALSCLEAVYTALPRCGPRRRFWWSIAGGLPVMEPAKPLHNSPHRGTW